MVISVRPISSEKTTAAISCLIAAERTMSRPIVDFPIAGRAAMTIIWPGCRPLVRASRSVNPVGTPVISPDAARGDLDLVDRGLDDVADGVVVLGRRAVGDGVDLGLRGVDDVLDVAAALRVAELDDAGAGLDEAAQHGPLARRSGRSSRRWPRWAPSAMSWWR